jgi:hypothetical protein
LEVWSLCASMPETALISIILITRPTQPSSSLKTMASQSHARTQHQQQLICRIFIILLEIGLNVWSLGWIIEHSIIDSVDADIRYGIDRLLIPIIRKLNPQRIPTEFIWIKRCQNQ